MLQFSLRIADTLGKTIQNKMFSNINKILHPNDQTTVEVTQMIFEAMDKNFGSTADEDKRVISGFLQDEMSNSFVCVFENSKRLSILFHEHKPVFNIYRPELVKPTCSILDAIIEVPGIVSCKTFNKSINFDKLPAAHALFGANEIKSFQISNTIYNLHATYMRK